MLSISFSLLWHPSLKDKIPSSGIFHYIFVLLVFPFYRASYHLFQILSAQSRKTIGSRLLLLRFSFFNFHFVLLSLSVSRPPLRRFHHIQLKSSKAIPHNYLDFKRVSEWSVMKHWHNVNVISRSEEAKARGGGRASQRAHHN